MIRNPIYAETLGNSSNSVPINSQASSPKLFPDGAQHRFLSSKSMFLTLADILHDRYTLLSIIKQRVHLSEIALAFDKITNQPVILKIVYKALLAELTKWRLFAEADFLKTLNHPNIIHLIDFQETRDAYVIVLEYMKDGDLLDWVQGTVGGSGGCGIVEIERVRVVGVQVALGLQYLHRKKLLHRDVKLENVVLDIHPVNPLTSTLPKSPEPEFSTQEDTSPQTHPHIWAVAKLIDFGLSAYSKSERYLTPCGTMGFMAPEVLFNDRYVGYGPAIDMWGLGCILHVLFTNRLPFSGTTHISADTMRIDFSDPVWQHVPVDAMEAVSRCLDIDPARRISADEFLKLPWVTCGDGSAVGLMETLVTPRPMGTAGGGDIAGAFENDRDGSVGGRGHDSDFGGRGGESDFECVSPPPGWVKLPDRLRTPSPGVLAMLAHFDREIQKRVAAEAESGHNGMAGVGAEVAAAEEGGEEEGEKENESLGKSLMYKAGEGSTLVIVGRPISLRDVVVGGRHGVEGNQEMERFDLGKRSEFLGIKIRVREQRIRREELYVRIQRI